MIMCCKMDLKEMELSISHSSIEKLEAILRSHEGYRQFPYKDTRGHLTVGIGRNLETVGINQDEATEMLANDIINCDCALTKYFPCYSELNDARKVVLIDMCFNMGIAGLLKFKNMIEALKHKEYKLAAKEMLDSEWAGQVGKRATFDANIMESGQL